MEDWMLWLVVIIILTVAEISTVNLVSVWFIISGVAALVVSIYNNNLTLQFGVFVIGGLILLLLTRPFLKKYMKKNVKEKVNLDRIIGMTGVVTEDILKNKIGEVKVDGKRWSAISKTKIPEGEEVTIESIDGVKLVVSKVKER